MAHPAGGVDSLVALQRDLLGAAADLVRPGGTLVYSVCTLSEVETLDIDRWLGQTHPELVAVLPPGAPFRPHGRGALLLPQRTDALSGPTDGMFLLRLSRGRPLVSGACPTTTRPTCWPRC